MWTIKKKNVEPIEETHRERRLRLKESKQELSQLSPTKCPECDNLLFHDGKRGELVCVKCGLVVKENIIDHGAEWRVYDSIEAKTRSRVGPPVRLDFPNQGLASFENLGNEISLGKTVSADTRNAFRRSKMLFRDEKRKINKYYDRSSIIGLIVSALGLPENIYFSAAEIFYLALEENLIYGHDTKKVVAASIYIVCRQKRIPRTLNEMEKASGVDRKYIGRYAKLLMKKLNLEISLVSPIDYLSRFCSKLGFKTTEVQQKAAELIMTVKEKQVSVGMRPETIAAAAILKASRDLGGENYRKVETIIKATATSPGSPESSLLYRRVKRLFNT